MKRIEAIIREEMLQPVKDALEDKGFIGMTTSDVMGRGQQKGISLRWRSGEYRVDFLPKKRIEVVVEDSDVRQVVDIICLLSRTGEAGDGKIFILPMEEVIRIRTGEKGTCAL